jgi:cell division septum initiation protein DivIVA
MSELATAREQLEQAISRLEQALATRGDDAALERALADARAETKNLRQVAETVSGRLDAAIGRLKSALETGA